MTAGAATSAFGRDIRILGLVGSGHFLSHFYHLALPPLFFLIKADFGLSFAALGLIITIFNAAAAAAQLPVGFLVDRIGGRIVLICGLVMEAGAIGAVAYVSTYDALLALAVLAGLGHSVFHPAGYAILMSSIGEDRIGRAFSVQNFAGSAGSAVAPATVVFLAALWDWRMALTVAAAVGIATALVMATQSGILKDGAAPEKNEESPTGTAQAEATKTGFEILFAPAVIVLFLFFLANAMIYSGMYTFSVTALVTVQGMSLAEAGTALTAFLVAGTGGILVGGELADRTNRHMLAAIIAYTAIAVIMFFIGWAALPSAALITMFAATGFLLGLVRPVRDMMVRDVTPPGAAGRVYGFMSCGQLLGGTAPPVVIGWMIDIGADHWVFWLIGIFAAASLLTAAVPKTGRG